MKDTLILGRGGQLARQLIQDWPPARALSSQECDLSQNADAIKAVLDQELQKQPFKILVNCAGYTQVDQAESEQAQCFLLNATAPEVLAQWCAQHQIKLVHFSTDFVFSGWKGQPYRVDDPTDALNVYGLSKAEGERRVLETLPEALVLRVSWLCGPGGQNFVETMRRLSRTKEQIKVVENQCGSPTFTPLIPEALEKLLAAGCNGRWHLHHEGDCSWKEFAQEIITQLSRSCQIIGIPADQWPRAAKTPNDSRLDQSATLQILGTIPSWRDGLKDYLARTVAEETVESQL